MANFKIVAIFLFFYLNLKNNCLFLVLYTHKNYEWMHKLKKLKTKSCVRLIHSLLFIFSLMIDSLIKQQTAWYQGSSKYQRQKKCTHIFLMANFKIVAIFLFFYLNLKNNCFFLVIYTHKNSG
jgi:hypothetical protein